MQIKNLLQPDQQLDTKRSALGERLDGNLKSSFNEQKEDFAKAPLPDQVIPPPSNNKDEVRVIAIIKSDSVFVYL